MNKLKKTVLLIIYQVAISIVLIAQPYQKGTFSVSAGAEALFAESKLSQSHKTGGGASIKGEYVFGKHTSATLASGFYFMNGKNTGLLQHQNIAAIPLKGGVRYYFGNFYGSGEVGAIYFTDFSKGTSFVYSVGLGDKIAINTRVIDIGLRHESWTRNGNTNSVIAFRLGYEFLVNLKPVRNTKHF
jgi:hypothetical protein